MSEYAKFDAHGEAELGWKRRPSVEPSVLTIMSCISVTCNKAGITPRLSM